MKVLSKLVGKTKMDIKNNTLYNTVVSNQLMTGRKEEEENGKNM